MVSSSDSSEQEIGTSPDFGDQKSTGEGRARIDSSEKNELLWRAIKLPIYSVALVPLSVSLHSLASCAPLLYAYVRVCACLIKRENTSSNLLISQSAIDITADKF
jgi:hypothetical protein